MFAKFGKTALATMLAGAMTVGAASAETLRLSHNTGDATTWQKGADRFAELVSEATGGDVSVRVFPNAQLAGGDQMRPGRDGRSRGARPGGDLGDQRDAAGA